MNDPFRELMGWLLLPFDVAYRISASCAVSIILVGIAFACIAFACVFFYGLAVDVMSQSPRLAP